MKKIPNFSIFQHFFLVSKSLQNHFMRKINCLEVCKWLFCFALAKKSIPIFLEVCISSNLPRIYEFIKNFKCKKLWFFLNESNHFMYLKTPCFLLFYQDHLKWRYLPFLLKSLKCNYLRTMYLEIRTSKKLRQTVPQTTTKHHKLAWKWGNSAKTTPRAEFGNVINWNS